VSRLASKNKSDGLKLRSVKTLWINGALTVLQWLWVLRHEERRQPGAQHRNWISQILPQTQWPKTRSRPRSGNGPPETKPWWRNSINKLCNVIFDVFYFRGTKIKEASVSFFSFIRFIAIFLFSQDLADPFHCSLKFLEVVDRLDCGPAKFFS